MAELATYLSHTSLPAPGSMRFREPRLESTSRGIHAGWEIWTAYQRSGYKLKDPLFAKRRWSGQRVRLLEAVSARATGASGFPPRSSFGIND